MLMYENEWKFFHKGDSAIQSYTANYTYYCSMKLSHEKSDLQTILIITEYRTENIQC